LKEEVKDRTLSKTRFVRGCGPVVRHYVVVVVDGWWWWWWWWWWWLYQTDFTFQKANLYVFAVRNET